MIPIVDIFSPLGSRGDGWVSCGRQDHLGLCARIPVPSVPQERKEAPISREVALTDALNAPEVRLEEGAETFGPMRMHLATSIGFLRVIDDLMHVALQRSIAAGGVGVELTSSLDGEPLIHFAQNVLTAVALGEQLFDELEHILPRVTSSRPHLLSDGDGSLGAG
jgi:hypothetical protein